MDVSPFIPRLNLPEIPDWLKRARRPFHDDLYAFFSSEFEGIVTEPLLMRVPIDDHLVHRGDGVFETLKCVSGRVYCFAEHLDRLFYSAEKISLKPLYAREDMRRLILETIRAGGQRDCLVRVLLARGVGSMGISPYDCPRPSLYILAHRLLPPFMSTHPNGARVITSDLPVKAGIFATIKTCNYLPNAMLKKEAVDRGADFAVNFDERGFVAEGATENFGLVTTEQVLIIPPPDRILAGTTMHRAFALADSGIKAGWLAGKQCRPIARGELWNASELLIFGTTTNVTAVTSLDGRPVHGGAPGPVAAKLNELILNDMQGDGPYTTPAFT